MQTGRPITYDPEKRLVIRDKEATRLLHRSYRQPWKHPGIWGAFRLEGGQEKRIDIPQCSGTLGFVWVDCSSQASPVEQRFGTAASLNQSQNGRRL